VVPGPEGSPTTLSPMAEPPGAPTSARREPTGDRATPPTEGVRIGAERAGRAEQRSGEGRRPRTDAPAPRGKVRARKVSRVVRHLDPWSVLKVSVLFYFVLFLIICVASAVLWGVGRSSGAIANVEDVITELGVFGECEPVEGGAPTTTAPPEVDDPLDQLTPPAELDADAFDLDELEDQRDDDGCLPGEEFVGGFRFEGAQLFAAFALGGLVLVVAGSVFNVVLAVLFNLISDLTGGVRVTVLEEEPRPERSGGRTGSPSGRHSG
jgi:hypothetical protein